MTENLVWALIAKYFSGECTEAEIALLDLWLEDADNYKIFTDAELAWRKQRQEETNYFFDVNKGLARLRERISKTLSRETEIVRNMQSQKMKIYQWVIGSFTILALVVFYANHDCKQIPLTTSVEKVTGLGEKINFTLPDGSKVWLNEKSSIQYPKEFGTNDREVVLTGEAFFEIMPNPAKPFIVQAQDFSTKVLGTSFNLKAYHEDSIAKISVMDGRVSVRKIEEENLKEISQVTPMEELVINRKSGVSYTDSVSSLSIATWRYHSFMFRNNTYEEVMNVLSRHFDVRISFENESLLQCRIMMSFGALTRLEEILELLSLSNGFTFNYNEENKQVKIFGGTCY